MQKNKISSFLSGNAKSISSVKKFEEASKGKSKEEIRQLEMKMLKPEEMPKYTGEKIRYIINSKLSAKIIFHDQEEMDLFQKHVSFAFYQGTSITNFKIITDLFHALEAGTITYDKKTSQFSMGSGEIKNEGKRLHRK